MFDECYYLFFLKFIKTTHKIIFDPEGTSEMAMKIVANFAENRFQWTVFCIRIQGKQM